MVNFVIIDINYKLDTIIKFVSKLIYFFLFFNIKVYQNKVRHIINYGKIFFLILNFS